MRLSDSCPTELELAGSLDALDPPLLAHLDTCAPCRSAHDSFVRAVELARELPLDLPSALERDRMRAAVLTACSDLAQPLRSRGMFAPVRETIVLSDADLLPADAPPPPRRLGLGTLPPPPAPRRRRSIPAALAGGIGVAAAAALWLAMPDPAPAPHQHGRVLAKPGARYTITHTPDEIVRLEDGEIEVDVAPLHPGERFRVVVGDAEIEVHGTRFAVRADRDRLLAVAVHHGLVEVRPAGRIASALRRGQSWQRTGIAASRAAAPTASSPSAAASPVASSPTATSSTSRPRTPASTPTISSPLDSRSAPITPSRTATVPTASARTPARAPDELAYDAGWTALRAGDFARAQAAFARVFLLAPDGALAEDASFWHAVALARGGRAEEATTAFRDFLAAHPRASRAGEASAMLGWLLVDARQHDEAARRFRAASGDANPSVRASARDGLAAIARQ